MYKRQITREAFVKYQKMSGVEKLAALEESYNDVKKDIDTKVVLLASVSYTHLAKGYVVHNG